MSTAASSHLKSFGIIALHGAVAVLAIACSTPSSDDASTDNGALTGSLADAKACAVRDAYGLATLSAFQPMSSAQLMAETSITAPSGTTAIAKFNVPSVGAVYIVETPGLINYYDVSGLLVTSLRGDAWQNAGGASLACGSLPSSSSGDSGVVSSSSGSSGSAAKTDASVVTTCLNTDPIDQTQYPYANAVPAAAGVCTAKEVTDLSAYYKAHSGDADFTATRWQTAVSEKCGQCVFTTVTDNAAATAWGPIVIKNDAIDTINRGGCIGAVSHNEECGKAYQQYQDCTFSACLKDCKTQTDFTACRQDARVLTTSCKGAFDTLKTACGEKQIGNYESMCKGTSYTFEGPATVMCVNGAP